MTIMKTEELRSYFMAEEGDEDEDKDEDKEEEEEEEA